MSDIEIKFFDLEEEEKIFLCTNLHAVSVTKNPDDETFEQIEKMQSEYLSLPPNIKEKIISSETAETVLKIGRNFNLQPLQIADISRAIRSYYFGEIKLEDFPNILAREIPVDINTARQISEQVIEKIIKNESLGIDKSLIDIPVFQAISTYPKVGEQLITSGMIKLKIFPQPVRPSIKNWIEDYRSMMGAERHGMMERGNYLFHSENAKRITFEERKKLAEILRSLDEGIALKIDSSNQQVIFSEIEVSQPAQPAFSQPQMPSAPASSGARGGKNIENYNPVSTNPLPRRQAPSYPLKSEQPITGAQNPFPAPQKEQPRPSYASSYNTQAGKSFDEIDSNSNSVKFSSPQVLSSEKNDRSSGYNVPSKKSEPRIQGNVVDLKN